MDIDALVEKSDFISEANKKDYKTWLFKINSKIDQEDIVPLLLNPEWLCELFYFQKNSVVSRQSYQRIRKRIQNLADYYKVNAPIPSHEDVLRARKIDCFYRDLNSLFSFINDVGKANMPNYDENLDLLHVKAISIFGWYGFTLNEAASTKKNSLCANKGSFFIAKTEIDETSYEILKNFSVAKGHRSFPSGKFYTYDGNEEYFFRTSVASQIISELNLKNHLAWFNNEILEYEERSIVYKQLGKNRAFVTINNDKSLRTTIEKIEDILKVSSRTARAIKKEFDQWQEDMGFNVAQSAPIKTNLTREQIKELALQAGFEIKDPKQ